MKSAVFTIIAKNYLAQARVLMDSIAHWAPELTRVVVLVDQPDGYFDPAGEDFEVILSADLAIPQSRWFHFKYTIMELCTAVKPFAFQALFDRGIDRVLYFDPDIEVFQTLTPLLRNLDDANFLLTPHLTSPLEDDCRPSTLDILRSGAYNLGFIGIRNGAEADRFLNWWQLRLYDHCVVDLPRGLFVDQRWVDLAPGLFDGVRIVREPGYNVAYWNLSHRSVQRGRDGAYEVNGQPLYFFHFSGLDADSPHRLSRHQNRFTLDDIGDAQQVVLEYCHELTTRGYAQCKRWPYAYGVFANGTPIPDMGRPVHHELPNIVYKVSDPFSDLGFRAFCDIWNQQLAGSDGRPTGITRFAYRIYRARADVQAAMPDIFGGDLVRFLNWMLSSGRDEHNLNSVFAEPLVESLKSVHRLREGPSEVVASGDHANPLLNQKIVQALAQGGIWINGDWRLYLGSLNELIANGDTRLHLSKLAKAIYESRPDLQSSFPDPCGRDTVRFLAWFLTYGVHEYHLTEALVTPLRKQWNTLLNSVNPLQRIWYRFVLDAMQRSLHGRSMARATLDRVRLARTYQAARFSDHQIHGATTAEGRSSHAEAAIANHHGFGLNIVGYLKSEMGVGESVRCAIRAARAADIPVRVRTVDSAGPYRLQDHSAGETDEEFPCPVNVFHVNADQSEQILKTVGEEFLAGKYNIGFWAWELEKFPDRWVRSFDLFDEIWTPTKFCQEAIARKSSVPVVRMPHAIQLDNVKSADRSFFSIPPDTFVFLFVFDILSVSERKNPLAVIEAFSRAFDGSHRCHLVLKINNAAHRPIEMATIMDAAAGLPITIIDSTLNRSKVNELIGACDCLVSLHRSEGFGLVLAEAMYLGKPVIATAYSGNLDFMTPDNSFLVNYHLVSVPQGCEPYDQDCLWAEPRLEHAVEQMRLAFGSPEVRKARAAAGQERIRRDFSPQAVGALMRERLDRICGGKTSSRARARRVSAIGASA